MRVIGSGHVYDAAAGPLHGRVCAHTTINCLHDGTVLVAFRRGTARDSLDGHVCVFASTDQGETWELRHDGVGLGAWDDTPGEVKCLAIAELTPGKLIGTSLWVDRSRPELPWIHPQTQGPAADARVPHHLHRWWPHVGPPTGGAYCPTRRGLALLLIRPGACPAACWPSPMSTGKPTTTATTPRPGARLRLSSDAGATWPEYVTVAVHPDAALYYWDQRLGQPPRYRPTRCDVLDPRRRPSAKTKTSTLPGVRRMAALGQQPVGTGLPGQHCQPLPVGGEQLVAVYAHRESPTRHPRRPQPRFRPHLGPHPRSCRCTPAPPGPSPAPGASRDQRELWQDMLAWRFGHPRAVLLPDGDSLGGVLRWRRCRRRRPLGTPPAVSRVVPLRLTVRVFPVMFTKVVEA